MWRRASAAILALTLTACATHTDSAVKTSTVSSPTTAVAQIPSWPPELKDFRFRWTAEPGIDLESGIAVPIRAYVESWRIAGMQSNMAYAYPGFTRVVPEDRDLSPTTNGVPAYLLTNVRPHMESEYEPATIGTWYRSHRYYGTEFLHLLEVTPTARGYSAVVCDGIYGIYRDNVSSGLIVEHNKFPTPDFYQSVIDSTAWQGSDRIKDQVHVWRVELTDKPLPGTTTPPAAVNQTGPDPAPTDDVFGPWRIVGANTDNSWESYPNFTGTDAPPYTDYLRHLEQCKARMPDNQQKRDEAVKALPRTPPKAAPAVPGWPAG